MYGSYIRKEKMCCSSLNDQIGLIKMTFITQLSYKLIQKLTPQELDTKGLRKEFRDGNFTIRKDEWRESRKAKVMRNFWRGARMNRTWMCVFIFSFIFDQRTKLTRFWNWAEIFRALESFPFIPPWAWLFPESY